MIGVKFRKFSFIRQKSERGVAMIEFALVAPVLITLFVMGFNLMRDIEVHMLRRDFSRSLLLSYSCSFQQKASVKTTCYQDVINNLTKYAASKYILNNVKTAKSGNFKYSIRTYTFSELVLKIKDKSGKLVTDASIAINAQRQRSGTSQCDSLGAIANASVTLDGEFSFGGLNSKFDARSNAHGEPIKVGHIFKDYLNDKNQALAMKNMCLNGSITIAEVEFPIQKFFKFGNKTDTFNTLYDVSYL